MYNSMNPTEFNSYLQREYLRDQDIYLKQNTTASCPPPPIPGNKPPPFVLQEQQKFIARYINENTPYRGLLLWHGLGSGKTCSAINIANQFLTKEKLIVIPAALTDNFIGDYTKCGDKEVLFHDGKPKLATPSDISMPGWASNMSYATGHTFQVFTSNGLINKYTQNRQTYKLTQKGKLVIIEESQILIERMTNALRERNSNLIQIHANQNILRAGGLTPKGESALKRAIAIKEKWNITNNYIHFYEDLKSDEMARIICLSGTPIVSNPMELAVAFNIIHGDITSWKLQDPEYQAALLDPEVVANIDVHKTIQVGTEWEIYKNPYGFINDPANPRQIIRDARSCTNDHFGIKLGVPSTTTTLFDVNDNYLMEAMDYDEFKRKITGLSSYFGNIPSLLPRVVLDSFPASPAFKTGNRLTDFGIGYDNNSNALYEIRYVQDSSLSARLDPLLNSAPPIIKAMLKDFGLSRNTHQFIYPGLVEWLSSVQSIRTTLTRAPKVVLTPEQKQLIADRDNELTSFGAYAKLRDTENIIAQCDVVESIDSPDGRMNSTPGILFLTNEGRVVTNITDKRGRNEEIITLEGVVYRMIVNPDGTITYDDTTPSNTFIINQELSTERRYIAKNVQDATHMVDRMKSVLKNPLLSRVTLSTPATVGPLIDLTTKAAVSTYTNTVQYNELVQVARNVWSSWFFQATNSGSFGIGSIPPTLQEFSTKIYEIIKTILDPVNAGKKHIIYSEFLQVNIPLIRALQANGYSEYGTYNDLKTVANSPRFMLYTGTGESEADTQKLSSLLDDKGEGKASKNRHEILQNFNDDEFNLHGEKVQILILNSAAAEGITTKGVRMVHLLHLPSNMSRLYQIIGRAIRNCTHPKLALLTPPEDTVTPILYLSNSSRPSYQAIVEVNGQNVPFLDILKETTIDCTLTQKITGRSCFIDGSGTAKPNPMDWTGYQDDTGPYIVTRMPPLTPAQLRDRHTEEDARATSNANRLGRPRAPPPAPAPPPPPAPAPPPPPAPTPPPAPVTAGPPAPRRSARITKKTVGSGKTRRHKKGSRRKIIRGRKTIRNIQKYTRISVN